MNTVIVVEIIIGLVVLAGVYVAVEGNPLTRNQQAVTYDASRVNQGTLQVTVSSTGPITNPNSVPLSFKNSGRLTEIDVNIGQQVTAGQTLAKLDTADLQAAVDQAKSTLAQQKDKKRNEKKKQSAWTDNDLRKKASQ